MQASVARPVHLKVPDGPGPFPVHLLLHGRGSSGSRILGRWSNPANMWSSISRTHVLVAPDGVDQSWNIVGEPSRQDDVSFVIEILDRLSSFSNVDAGCVQLFGFSNGAGLVNRILIECDDRRIVRAVTDSSQLNQKQYRDNTFYVGGDDNGYSVVKQTLIPRCDATLQSVNPCPVVCVPMKLWCRMCSSFGPAGLVSCC